MSWSPSSDASVIGYNLYYGSASHTYTNKVDAGNARTATISNLVAGATYYFAATAYDLLGLESDYSNEIAYQVLPVKSLRIRGTPASRIILTVTGQTGHAYQILATQDLKSWTVIGLVTPGAGGWVEFTDPDAAKYPARFYRTGEVPGVQIRVTPARLAILTVTGQSALTYEIQATQTLTNWTAIGTVTLGADGSSLFTDTNSARYSSRFYRTRQIP